MASVRKRRIDDDGDGDDDVLPSLAYAEVARRLSNPAALARVSRTAREGALDVRYGARRCCWSPPSAAELLAYIEQRLVTPIVVARYDDDEDDEVKGYDVQWIYVPRAGAETDEGYKEGAIVGTLDVYRTPIDAYQDVRVHATAAWSNADGRSDVEIADAQTPLATVTDVMRVVVSTLNRLAQLVHADVSATYADDVDPRVGLPTAPSDADDDGTDIALASPVRSDRAACYYDFAAMHWIIERRARQASACGSLQRGAASRCVMAHAANLLSIMFVDPDLSYDALKDDDVVLFPTGIERDRAMARLTRQLRAVANTSAA